MINFKKVFLPFLALGSFLLLTGCENVKFVEKAPEEVESKKAPEVELGELDIDPNDSDHMESAEDEKERIEAAQREQDRKLKEQEKKERKKEEARIKKEKKIEKEKAEKEKKREEAERKREEEAEKKKAEEEERMKNKAVHDNVIFDLVDTEMYVKEDVKIFSTANLLGNPFSTLVKGAKVNLKGLSEDDKTIAMIEISTGSIMFCKSNNLTKEEVGFEEKPVATEVKKPEEAVAPPQPQVNKEEPKKEQVPQPAPAPAPTPTPAPKPAQTPQPQPQPKPQPQPRPEPQPVPQPQPQPTPQPAPQPTPQPAPTPQARGGISYPSNPQSTSVNFGVTFADENFTATLLRGAALSSGPGPISGSTGYGELEYLSEGMTVNCTGIGDNGYIRIALANGVVGFIHNQDLMR